MWDFLTHVGLILGIIVSIGSIFGYVANVLPIFKNVTVQNPQTHNSNDQSSNANAAQQPARNLIIPTVIGIVFVSFFSFCIAYMNYRYDLTNSFLGIVTLNSKPMANLTI